MIQGWKETVKRVGGAFRRPAPSRLRQVKVGIDFERRPDPSWQAALDVLCPPSDTSGRLVIVWDAGDRWQPIHRWTVMQVQPWAFVDEHYKEILSGPHVRTGAMLSYAMATVDGKTEPRPRVEGEYAGRGIDRLQYDTHHMLRRQGILGLPRRFWVVQGDEGGHPFALSRTEETRWEAEGRTHYAPGDLPFADFDRRVIDAVMHYDLWKYANKLGDPVTFAARAKIERMQADEIATSKIQWKRWGNLIERIVPELAHAAKQDGLHRLRLNPVGHTSAVVDPDEAYEQYTQPSWETTA